MRKILLTVIFALAALALSASSCGTSRNDVDVAQAEVLQTGYQALAQISADNTEVQLANAGVQDKNATVQLANADNTGKILDQSQQILNMAGMMVETMKNFLYAQSAASTIQNIILIALVIVLVVALLQRTGNADEE